MSFKVLLRELLTHLKPEYEAREEYNRILTELPGILGLRNKLYFTEDNRVELLAQMRKVEKLYELYKQHLTTDKEPEPIKKQKITEERSLARIPEPKKKEKRGFFSKVWKYAGKVARSPTVWKTALKVGAAAGAIGGGPLGMLFDLVTDAAPEDKFFPNPREKRKLDRERQLQDLGFDNIETGHRKRKERYLLEEDLENEMRLREHKSDLLVSDVHDRLMKMKGDVEYEDIERQGKNAEYYNSGLGRASTSAKDLLRGAVQVGGGLAATMYGGPMAGAAAYKAGGKMFTTEPARPDLDRYDKKYPNRYNRGSSMQQQPSWGNHLINQAMQQLFG